MWILSEQGFYSVVQKEWNVRSDSLTIRARCEADLENLRAFLPAMTATVESNDSDYRFRTVAGKDAVADAVAGLVRDIDYDNFKARIATESFKRASIYGRVVRRQNIWHIRRRKLTESGPRLGFGFRRRACGVASVDVRWSVA